MSDYEKCLDEAQIRYDRNNLKLCPRGYCTAKNKFEEENIIQYFIFALAQAIKKVRVLRFLPISFNLKQKTYLYCNNQGSS